MASSNPDIDDFNLDDTPPVSRLKEGLPMRQLIEEHHTEFEVKVEDNHSVEVDALSENIEKHLKFDNDEFQNYINLDMLNVEDGDKSPFDKYRRKMTNVTEDGKLKKFILKPGVGCLVPDNSLVYVRYEAYIEYSEIPFDSTLNQGNFEKNISARFNLGSGGVIAGIHQAILSMRKGEQAEFLIHPDLYYGKLGCPPRIPPDAFVLFKMEIDKYIDCGDIYLDEDLNQDERNKFCNAYKVAKGHYKLANNYFREGNVGKALRKYRMVINLVHNAQAANEEEEEQRNHFLIKMYTNTCICYKKQNNYKKICSMATDALYVNKGKALNNFKLLYHWGYAKMALGDYGAATKHLQAAQKLSPNSVDIFDALQELARRKLEDQERERIMMQKFFEFKPQAKVSEYNEAEECVRASIKEQIQIFKENPNLSSKTVTQNLTYEDEQLWIEIAKDMGLFARIIESGNRHIQIRKPQEF